MTFAQSELSS